VIDSILQRGFLCVQITKEGAFSTTLYLHFISNGCGRCSWSSQRIGVHDTFSHGGVPTKGSVIHGSRVMTRRGVTSRRDMEGNFGSSRNFHAYKRLNRKCYNVLY
jgi:hypothetical protein